MYKFQSADRVVMDGRGMLFTFKGIKGFDPRVLKGEIVDIDGHACKVDGVETFAVLDPSGFDFGLLIKG